VPFGQITEKSNRKGIVTNLHIVLKFHFYLACFHMENVGVSNNILVIVHAYTTHTQLGYMFYCQLVSEHYTILTLYRYDLHL